MKINNAYEMQQWREQIGKMLKESRWQDSKEGLIGYLMYNMPNLYEEIKPQLPADINELNWKQIAELIG